MRSVQSWQLIVSSLHFEEQFTYINTNVRKVGCMEIRRCMKADYDEIIAHIEDLGKQPYIGSPSSNVRV